jgi:VWFA-related protein
MHQTVAGRAIIRRGATVLCLMFAMRVAVAGQRNVPREPSIDLVVLDVAVTDRNGAPILDLTADDFRVKEDGELVRVKTFEAVRATRDGDLATGRTVALLLDDTGVPVLGTTAIQELAKAVLSLSRLGDEVSVVRLHGRADEAYGDVIEALARIDAYRGGAMPFSPIDAQVNALRRIAAMARQLAVTEGRRKAIVCIGTQLVCDVSEPRGDARSSVFTAWREAVAETAKANVAVYAIVPGRLRMSGGGIVDATGGLTHGSLSDFRRPIETLWNDTGAHYLLGYWPGSKRRPVHSISVDVERDKVRIRARRRRAD